MAFMMVRVSGTSYSLPIMHMVIIFAFGGGIVLSPVASVLAFLQSSAIVLSPGLLYAIIANLEIVIHPFYFSGRVYRPFLADIDIAHIAPAAFAHAALHPVLQRGVNAALVEAEFQQGVEDELDHYRRAAGDGDRVLGLGRGLFQDRGHEAYLALPVVRLSARVDRLDEGHIPPVFPVLQFFLVYEVR